MPPRPDSQSFTRLLISAGLFLVIAAFVVPGLILRDTGVLAISQEDLDGLSTTAEKELKRRQGVARDVGEAAPYLGLVFLIGGTVLIALGVPRLRRQERTDDERLKMEIDKLRGELKPQTAQERTERLREDVDEDEPAESSQVPGYEADAIAESTASPEGEIALQRSSDPPSQLRQWADAEAAVLARLAEIAPPLYDLRSQVKVEGEMRLLLDALLISQIEQLPDIVVEIKYSRGGNANLHNRISDAKEQLLRYLARFRRNSIGWLIIVAEREPSPGRRAELEESLTETSDVLRLSIVSPENLDQLVMPGVST